MALRRGDVSSEAAYEAHGVTRLLCVRENNAPHCGADSSRLPTGRDLSHLVPHSAEHMNKLVDN